MLFLFIACSNGTTVDDTESLSEGDVTWVADIAPIVGTSCVGCHSRDGIGSFPLETYDDVFLVKDAVADAVANRRMPPWLASQGCAEYRNDISLSDEEIDRIQQWVDGGAPEGNLADTVDFVLPEWPVLEDPDVVLELPVVYTPTEAPDDYRCFVVDWPEEETSYVVGYDVKPGNERVVHHLVAYIAPPEHAEFYEGLQAAEAGAGYTCYGGPGAPDGQDGNAVDWLGAWAPGGGYNAFPEGVGVKMDPGSKVILQMHYNLEGVEPGEEDRTEMHLELADDVERNSWIQPWADPSWLNSEAMEIPAGTEGVTHSFRYALPTTLTLYSSNVHMHKLGVSGRMYIDRGDGDEECLVDIPRYDFNWQRAYGFVEPKVVNAGDEVVVECTWDNPGDQDVFWGEGTGDEMCLGTMLMAVGAP
jgi:hypothetical protein